MKETPVILVPLSRVQRYGTLSVVIGAPLLGFAGAIFFGGFSLLNLSLFLSLYLFTGLWGVCIGLHRYFTHASFKTTPAIEVSLALAAHFAIEGRIDQWVPNHSIHHDHSDTSQDLHSPYLFGNEEFGFWKGFLHAHTAWMLQRRVANQREHTPPRILENRRIQRIDALGPFLIVSSFLISPIIGGLATWSWHGAWTAFIWGSLLRIAFVHHITWSVNSICHMFGGRPFNTGDQSRNNWIFGFLSFGEGYHNNHHMFRRSARHGLLGGQPDLSAWVIERLEQVGLVWDVSRPSEETIQNKLVA